MLWLALHLHTLALNVFPPDALPEGPVRPRIVVASHGRGERLEQVDALAASLGLKPGMKLSAALALVNELVIHRRRLDREQEALTALATWAQQFTPTVVCSPPATLLLEIGGCLTYFGGLVALRSRIEQGLTQQEYGWRSALAPTALAAAWLAQQAETTPVLRLADLPAHLGTLPTSVLLLDPRAHQLLQQLGISTLAQLLALPRAGLNRRFGTDLARQLAQALGAEPDPRALHVAPDHYQRTIDLDWPVETVDVFLKLARRLLDGLAAFLSGRGLGVQQLRFRFTHEELAPTTLTVGMGQTSCSASAWQEVLREKVVHYRLAAPATSVGLIADHLHPLSGEARDLFGHASGGDITLLLARLMARLGAEAVTGLATASDHRPEHASATVTPGQRSPALVVGLRPGWLLPQPQSLPERDGHPWQNGALQLVSLPERIEAGWWDDDPIARDYYIATAPDGRCYWVFRNRVDQSWWLHGVFG